MINVLGLAGSGKSTQGKLLAKRLNCPWISIGELLRSDLHGDDRRQMLEGKIIDDKIALAILEKDLASKAANNKEVILDGFPRSLGQAEWLVSKVNKGEIMMTGVIHLVAQDKVALSRLLQRGRKDDTHEAIHQRFSDYETTILPILNYMRQQGMSVYDIDGNGNVEEVERLIDGALGLE